MNSKADDKYNTLVTFFKDETGWNKARVKFFSLLGKGDEIDHPLAMQVDHPPTIQIDHPVAI